MSRNVALLSGWVLVGACFTPLGSRPRGFLCRSSMAVRFRQMAVSRRQTAVAMAAWEPTLARRSSTHQALSLFVAHGLRWHAPSSIESTVRTRVVATVCSVCESARSSC
jgi:hypothetical protein